MKSIAMLTKRAATTHPLHHLLRIVAVAAVVGGAAAPGSVQAADEGTLADTLPFSPLAGIRGAFVERIAVDPHNASRIYASAGGGRIARSADGGVTWHLVPAAGPTETFRALAVHPTNGGIVLAYSTSDPDGCTSGGVYQSRDFGAHWHRLASQPVGTTGPGGCGRGLVIDPGGTTIVLADRRQGIFLSSDSGLTWTNPLPRSRARPYALAADPNDPSTLWAAGLDPSVALAASAWVSHDFGRTWSTVPTPAFAPPVSWTPTAVAVQPGTRKVLIGAGGFDPVTFDGVVRILASGDGGLTWVDSSAGLVGPADTGIGIGNSIVFDPRSPAIVYASTNGGNGGFRSTDGGATWSRMRLPWDAGLFTLAAGDTRVYAGGSSFFASADLGLNWSALDAGLNAAAARLVVDDATFVSGTYAISSFGALVHGAGGGARWSAVDPEPGIRATAAIAVDPVASTHPVYAVTQNRGLTHFWRGGDLGRTWSPLQVPVPPTEPHDWTLLADPLQAGHVYAIYTTDFLFSGGLRSADFGEHWSEFSLGVPGDYPVLGYPQTPLVADPAHPGTLYAAMASGLWKSGDSGASWSLMPNLPVGAYGIAALTVVGGPSGGVFVVAGADDGSFTLQKSTDGGVTWTAASTGGFGTDPLSLAGGPGGRLFAYTSNFFGFCPDLHLLQSTDGAATWTELPAAGAFATFAFGDCPGASTTRSALFVGDPFGAFVTYGGDYRELDPRGSMGPVAANRGPTIALPGVRQRAGAPSVPRFEHVP